MINNWNDLLLNAQPLINYLGRASYFQDKYSGKTNDRLILTGAALAIKYALDDSGDVFDGWEAVSDSPNVFPGNFEWMRWVDYNLKKNNYFNLAAKDFNGADTKWTQAGACLLLEFMCRDIRILLNCYANGVFPKIWQDILEVYLEDGFPCGWDGRYPDGRLVAFSNR